MLLLGRCMLHGCASLPAWLHYVLQTIPHSAALWVIALSHACLADNDCKPKAVPASGASWAASLDLTVWRAVQYMIQCKFAEAAKHAGRLVDTHTVILVRLDL